MSAVDIADILIIGADGRNLIRHQEVVHFTANLDGLTDTKKRLLDAQTVVFFPGRKRIARKAVQDAFSDLGKFLANNGTFHIGVPGDFGKNPSADTTLNALIPGLRFFNEVNAKRLTGKGWDIGTPLRLYLAVNPGASCPHIDEPRYAQYESCPGSWISPVLPALPWGEIRAMVVDRKKQAALIGIRFPAGRIVISPESYLLREFEKSSAGQRVTEISLRISSAGDKGSSKSLSIIIKLENGEESGVEVSHPTFLKVLVFALVAGNASSPADATIDLDRPRIGKVDISAWTNNKGPLGKDKQTPNADKFNQKVNEVLRGTIMWTGTPPKFVGRAGPPHGKNTCRIMPEYVSGVFDIGRLRSALTKISQTTLTDQDREILALLNAIKQ